MKKTLKLKIAAALLAVGVLTSVSTPAQAATGNISVNKGCSGGQIPKMYVKTTGGYVEAWAKSLTTGKNVGHSAGPTGYTINAGPGITNFRVIAPSGISYSYSIYC